MPDFWNTVLFYTFSILSLIFTTIYLYYNRKVALKFDKNYSFQLSFFSFISMFIFSFYEIYSWEISFNLWLSFIFIIIIWWILAIRTFLIENIIQKVDVGYFELFMKFWLIFIIIFEILFLDYIPNFNVFLWLIIFFFWISFVLKFKNEKNLNFKNIQILLLIAFLFSISPFLVKFIVENNYLSLSLVFLFELLTWTIIIWITRPKTIVFEKKYFNYFFPLCFIRMLWAYFWWKAILIWSPTITELIKSTSILLLFIIPVFLEWKKIWKKSFLWILLSFLWVSLIIYFK